MNPVAMTINRKDKWPSPEIELATSCSQVLYPTDCSIGLGVRNREKVYNVAVYQKYLTRLEELIIFEPWRQAYHFSQPR